VVRVIHTWPSLESVWTHSNQPAWKAFTPHCRLLKPKRAPGTESTVDNLGPANVSSRALDPAFEKLSAFVNFRRSIPAEIVAAVEGFSSRQMALLRVCRKRERAKDLLMQNPALAFGLFHNQHFLDSSSESVELAATLSRNKQHDIVKWLGFPDSQAWVNILAKLPVGLVSLETVLGLRSAARNPGTERLLCHLNSLNSGVVALLTPTVARFVTPHLLEEVAASDDESLIPQTILMLENIFEAHKRMCTEVQQRGFRSIAEVRLGEQEAAEHLSQFLKRLESESKKLPQPPLPGTQHIVALVTEGQLEDEGRVQHNCVGGYARRVHASERYIYRVMSPERATLSILKGPDGCWRIGDLRLSCNRPVAPETRKAVQDWLDGYSFSI